MLLRLVYCVWNIRTEQFDTLLQFMINYFRWFFAKREKETYTNPVHMWVCKLVSHSPSVMLYLCSVWHCSLADTEPHDTRANIVDRQCPLTMLACASRQPTSAQFSMSMIKHCIAMLFRLMADNVGSCVVGAVNVGRQTWPLIFACCFLPFSQ